MNGIDFLADTNALIYILNGNSCMPPSYRMNWLFLLFQNWNSCLSME